MQSSIVMKIGGSLLYNDGLIINRRFLLLFAKWYEKAKLQYKDIILVIGGGKISRHVTNQLLEITPTTEALHAVGMEATRLNAEILKAVLNDEKIFVPQSLGGAMEHILTGEGGTIVTGGHKVGWSSDMDAAVFADILDLDMFYKISNVDSIYTGDPAVDPTATPIKDYTWMKYLTDFGIVPGVTKNVPGFSTPIGSYAAQFCTQKGISVRFTGGNVWENVTELDELLTQGTFVHP